MATNLAESIESAAAMFDRFAADCEKHSAEYVTPECVGSAKGQAEAYKLAAKHIRSCVETWK